MIRRVAAMTLLVLLLAFFSPIKDTALEEVILYFNPL